MLRIKPAPTAFLVASVLAPSLSGCSCTIQTGDDAKAPVNQGQPAAAGQTAPLPPPQARKRPPVPATAVRITSPNAFGNGKAGAFQGLAYVLPENTQRIPPNPAGMVPFAALYTDSFEIQPQEFTSGFPGALVQNDWFMIRYEGSFNVPRNGGWQFRVISDDGAILYIDDKRVVENDGVHTPKTADGLVALTAGPHWLRLDYFQASKGQVALSVLMGQNGAYAPLKGTP
jgi:hypothetical protein